MKILLEAGPGTVDLRALFSNTPQEETSSSAEQETAESPEQEPNAEGTWKWEKDLITLGFNPDIIKKLKAFGEPFEKILEVYGTQVNSAPTSGDNPVLAFLRQTYIQEKLIKTDLLNASTFKAVYNALAKKQVAHGEFWEANNYNIIYCVALYKKSVNEMSEYLNIQKNTLPPDATSYSTEALFNRKIFFTNEIFGEHFVEQNVKKKAKEVMDYAGNDIPEATDPNTKLNDLKFVKEASGNNKEVESTVNVGSSAQSEIIDNLTNLAKGNTTMAIIYKYAAILSLAITTDSSEAKKALGAFPALPQDKVAEAVVKIAEKKIMPRGRINKSDADALTANIIKSIKGSTTDTTEG